MGEQLTRVRSRCVDSNSVPVLHLWTEYQEEGKVYCTSYVNIGKVERGMHCWSGDDLQRLEYIAHTHTDL